jgi:LysR family transcriptional activator of nhaA
MAMVRLLTREGAGLAVVPPIVVRDELETRQLRDYGQLPGVKESFFALTAKRRFPNPMIGTLMSAWRNA